jgi:hypothetical protein
MIMPHLNLHPVKLNVGQFRPAFLGVALLCLFCLSIMAGCSASASSQSTSKPAKESTSKIALTTASSSSKPTGDSVGLTSIEAAQLVWPKAKGNFGDAVLFRMAPIADKDSTDLSLAGDWQETGRSANWFIWYADPNGENWLMFAIKGKKLVHTDIGTRSWSIMAMGADWPREKPAVAIEDAADSASRQGANMDALTWVELACDYPASFVDQHPCWVFACSETASSGLTLNYRIFVDAITGEVAGALNDRNEEMTLPIDLANLEKPRSENHQSDLQAFFALIIKKDWTFAIFQLSYNLAPDDAMRQSWLASFQSLDLLEVVSMEPANLLEWSNEWEEYKVVLRMKTSEPVEKFGWENGENTRWVSIIPQGAGYWKIDAISSSP